MKFKELENKTKEELLKILAESRNKLKDLRFAMVANKLKNFQEIKETKKTIARILTLLNRH